MNILIIGATGRTGLCLVTQLLDQGHSVAVIVRTPEKLPQDLRNHENLSITASTVLDMSDEDVAQHIGVSDAIVSCLGHTLDFQGLWGHPRHLVSGSIRRLYQAIQSNNSSNPVKLLLLSSVACQNSDAGEKISFAQLCVIGLLRLLVPPHSDNEKAVNYLRTMKNSNIEWVAIRPDSLIENDVVSPYSINVSPRRSIFNPGKTSRINVAHLMMQLITDADTWSKWKGHMPVIYNEMTVN